MKRKDYELIARIIRTDVAENCRDYVAHCIADGFRRADANFDTKKFIVLALGKGHAS